MSVESTDESTSKLFERFMLVFATVEPLATVPQIVQIWSGTDTSGVSLITWFFYTVTSTIWLVYGFKIKAKPIIISGILWVASQGLVVIGLLTH
jgi:uncharacterized protein with PQ loop repeat